MHFYAHDCCGLSPKYVFIIYCVINVIIGALPTPLIRIQYLHNAHGYPDFENVTMRSTAHPFLVTAFTFFGRLMSTLPLGVATYYQKQKAAVKEPIKLEWRSQLILAVPTLCDFVSTVISSIGLLWVDSSVYQMLRGSLIIFVGIMSRVILKRVLTKTQASGIAASCMGVIVVSLSSVFGSKRGNADTLYVIIGICLILVGQSITSLQMILEEIFLKKRKLEPLNVVGMEGVYGFILGSIALVVTYFLPGDSGPLYRQEDALDAFKQMSNNPVLLATSISYTVSIAFFNFSGISITRALSATSRTLLDTCRTCVVWTVGLILYYGFGLTQYGEAIDLWSITKVDGFILLIIGTALYNTSNETDNSLPHTSHISIEIDENEEFLIEENTPLPKNDFSSF